MSITESSLTGNTSSFIVDTEFRDKLISNIRLARETCPENEDVYLIMEELLNLSTISSMSDYVKDLQ